MTTQLPSYILRDCMLWADSVSKLGQIGEINVPVPKAKMDELRNAGMIKPRDVVLGYEKLELSFKLAGFDPQILKLFGLAPGSESPFMVTGALVDEDGTVHSAVLTIRGFINGNDPGSWKPGDMPSNDNTVSVNYYKLEIDGNEIYEVDDFDISVGGVSQYQGIRNALLL